MLNIQKGISAAPPKVVIYGPEGIGKSTLASKFPAPLFIDVEEGTGRMDVARLTLPDKSFSSFKTALKELAAAPPDEYKTLVIDTGDTLDNMISDHVVASGGKDIVSIESFGWGKGYTYIKEEWTKLLDRLWDFQKRNGWGVVFVCHATLRKVEAVGQTGNYDQWALKLSRQASPILKEWCDFMLFLNYDVTIVKTGDDKGTKTKAVGGDRTAFCIHSNYYEAKNRGGLPDSLELDDAGVRTILRAIYPAGNPAGRKARMAESAGCNNEPPRTAETPSPAPEEEKFATEPVKADEPRSNSPADLGVKKEAPPAVDPEIARLCARIDNALQVDGLTRADLERETVRKGMRPAGTPLESFSLQDLNRISTNYDKIAANIKKMKGE